ncbi:hypothetical protein ACFL34_03395 [Candidatus Sumerlaeota bacterium]
MKNKARLLSILALGGAFLLLSHITFAAQTTITYSYDKVYRLTGASYSHDNSVTSYTYDANGNRLSMHRAISIRSATPMSCWYLYE